MATLDPRLLSIDTGSSMQVVLNDQLQNHCVVFSAVVSNSLGVGLKHTCSMMHLLATSLSGM